MKKLPEKLQVKLDSRVRENAMRKLPEHYNNIDFSSNDYLGFASSKKIYDRTHLLLEKNKVYQNGATGSRLLSGNHALYMEAESLLATFHNAEAALIFNSGYDANVGFFSSIPQRRDIILYDEFIHASIRDGIKMSNARAYKFRHNDLEDLKKRLQQFQTDNTNHNELVEVYVVTESVFSMDGDSPDLTQFIDVCNRFNGHIIIDEAHATGVFGDNGVGLIQKLQLENQVFARINTFGKALGCHGAVILGSEKLKNYLINFSRSFIYTTGLPPHSVATIITAYQELQETNEIEKLNYHISLFKQEIITKNLTHLFIESNSAIHCCVISGNNNVIQTATKIQECGFDVKPIISPTVPEGKERLRFCLHSYNTKEEITEVLQLLATFVQN